MTTIALDEAVRGKFVSMHALNIALTVFVAEWIHTLPLEIEVIWTAKWNLVKVLYILNRYFLFDMFCFYVYLEVADLETCRISFILCGVTAMIGLALAESVIFLRLYALSGQSMAYRIWLPLMFGAVQVVTFTLLGLFLRSEAYAPSPLPQQVACLRIYDTNDIAAAISGLIVAMATEIAVLSAMVYLGHKKHRRMRSPLITTFYRDGIAYFLAFLGSSVVNIVLLLSLPPSVNTMFAIPQRTIHSIFASRMIIHLREQSYQQENGYKFKNRLDSSILHPLSFRAHKSDVTTGARWNAKTSFLDVRDMMQQTSGP